MAFAKPTTDVTEFKIGDENEKISLKLKGMSPVQYRAHLQMI